MHQTNHSQPANRNQPGAIVGIGSALMDILVRESDEYAAQTGVPKGGMLYFDRQAIDETVARAANQPLWAPGGAACNTIVGIARLGGRGRFVGKVGNDALGLQLRQGLEQAGVEPLLTDSDTATGRVFSIITPDAQRTMMTCLGASAEMRPDDITSACFADAAMVLIEGYLLFNPDLIMAATGAARAAGVKIALDLASFTVVEQSRDMLTRLIEAGIDILLANEDEARVYTGYSDPDKALSAMAADAHVAVLKLGAKGSMIQRSDTVMTVPALIGGAPTDTTGAGDLWAAGFLYGLSRQWPLAACGRLAAACGWEVCRVVGAGIPDQGWIRIKQLAHTLEASH